MIRMDEEEKKNQMKNFVQNIISKMQRQIISIVKFSIIYKPTEKRVEFGFDEPILTEFDIEFINSIKPDGFISYIRFDKHTNMFVVVVFYK